MGCCTLAQRGSIDEKRVERIINGIPGNHFVTGSMPRFSIVASSSSSRRHILPCCSASYAPDGLAVPVSVGMSALPQLKAFTLTHILYDPLSPPYLSIPLTLLSLSPIFLFVSYFTLLVVNRQLTILLLGVGSIGNEALSWALKRVLKGMCARLNLCPWPGQVSGLMGPQERDRTSDTGS